MLNQLSLCFSSFFPPFYLLSCSLPSGPSDRHLHSEGRNPESWENLLYGLFKKLMVLVGLQCNLTFGLPHFFGVAECVESVEYVAFFKWNPSNPLGSYVFFLSAIPESRNPRILESSAESQPLSLPLFPRNPVESATFFAGIRVESATFFWNPRAYVRLCQKRTYAQLAA